jgi:hypothetical protein
MILVRLKSARTNAVRRLTKTELITVQPTTKVKKIFLAAEVQSFSSPT